MFPTRENCGSNLEITSNLPLLTPAVCCKLIFQKFSDIQSSKPATG